jgi:gluconolactonase
MTKDKEQATNLRVLAKDLQFPEGPVVLDDGTIMVVEIAAGRISVIAPDGRVRVFAHTGGGPNGLAVGPDGCFYVCNNGGNIYRPGSIGSMGPAPDYGGGYIQRVSPQGTVEVVHTHCDGRIISAPNDIVFDKAGGYYFTDLGKRMADYRYHGGVYYSPPDHSRLVEVVHPMLTPNGIGLSPDESILYVADTETARLIAYDITQPGVVRKETAGAVSHGRLVCELPGTQRFDSLAVDAQGNIAVATLVSGYVTVISPSGDILARIKTPGTYPTNLCFGGADLRTAFITLSDLGQVVLLDWATQGMKPNFADRAVLER